MHVPARKAVEIIGVSPGTLRKWADNDKIQYIKIGRASCRERVSSPV